MDSTRIVLRGVAWTVPGALAASALLLAIAPLLLPESYSPISMSLSEAGAQGVANGWVARLGFLCFAAAVLRLCLGARRVWERSALALHAAFGASMVGVAVFSHRPWQIELPYSAREDMLHSVFATGMGFAFALGVVTRWIQRRRRGPAVRALDALAVGAATFVPIAMSILPAFAGVLQRTMFAVAYVWYANEAIGLAAEDT